MECSDAVGLVQNIARGSTTGHVGASVTLWNCVCGGLRVRMSFGTAAVLTGYWKVSSVRVLIRQEDDGCFRPIIRVFQFIYLSFYYRLHLQTNKQTNKQTN